MRSSVVFGCLCRVWRGFVDWFCCLADDLFPFEQGDPAPAMAAKEPAESVWERRPDSDRRVAELHKSLDQLRFEFERHRRDCEVFASRIGTDVGNLQKQLQAMSASLRGFNANKSVDRECLEAVSAEIQELHHRMGEMEDRFSSRTDFFAKPSQN